MPPHLFMSEGPHGIDFRCVAGLATCSVAVAIASDCHAIDFFRQSRRYRLIAIDPKDSVAEKCQVVQSPLAFLRRAAFIKNRTTLAL